MEEGSDWRSSPDVQKYYHHSLGMIRHHPSEKGSHEGKWYHYSDDKAKDPTHDKGFTTPKDAMSHAENLSKTKIKEDGTTTVDNMGYAKPMAIPMRRNLRSRRNKPKKVHGASYLKGKFESKKPVREAFDPKEGWKYRKPGPSGREQGAGSSYEHPEYGTIVKSFKGSGYVHFPEGTDKTSHSGTFKTPEEAMIHAIGYHKAAYGT